MVAELPPPAPTRRALAGPPPAALSYSTLGGFGLRRGGEPVAAEAWERPMAARLVRLLIVRGSAATPEDLVLELLWPDRDPRRARRCLAVTLSRVRAVLDRGGPGPSRVAVVGRTFRLELRPGDAIDADAYESAGGRACRDRSPGRRRALERAAELWAGEPLPEERYTDWATPWRERLLDRRREVLGALADAEAADGDHFAALRTARTLLEDDAVDEAAHRRVMAAQAALGRRARALEQYMACRRALLDLVGIEPSRETLALHDVILRGDALSLAA